MPRNIIIMMPVGNWVKNAFPYALSIMPNTPQASAVSRWRSSSFLTLNMM